MYLLAKFDNHRSYRNEDIKFYVNNYMGTLERADLTASIHYIGRFLKWGIPIYNSEVPDTAGRKTRKRKKRTRRLAIAKCYAFHANAITLLSDCTIFIVIFVLSLSYFISNLCINFLCSYVHYIISTNQFLWPFFFSWKMQNRRPCILSRSWMELHCCRGLIQSVC